MSSNVVIIAAHLKSQSYATGQFGKNRFHDLNKFLLTAPALPPSKSVRLLAAVNYENPQSNSLSNRAWKPTSS